MFHDSPKLPRHLYPSYPPYFIPYSPSAFNALPLSSTIPPFLTLHPPSLPSLPLAQSSPVPSLAPCLPLLFSPCMYEAGPYLVQDYLGGNRVFAQNYLACMIIQQFAFFYTSTTLSNLHETPHVSTGKMLSMLQRGKLVPLNTIYQSSITCAYCTSL